MKTHTTFCLALSTHMSYHLMLRNRYALLTDSVLQTRQKPRNIIVRFVSYRDKAVFYANKNNLKGIIANSNNCYRIFINKALTKMRSIIYASARQAVRSGRAKRCCTTNGQRVPQKTNIFCSRRHLQVGSLVVSHRI